MLFGKDLHLLQVEEVRGGEAGLVLGQVHSLSRIVYSFGLGMDTSGTFMPQSEAEVSGGQWCLTVLSHLGNGHLEVNPRFPHAGCILHPSHLPCNWNFVPFDQLSPIPPPLSPASCHHKSDSFFYNLGILFHYVICLFIFYISLRAWIVCFVSILVHIA